MPLTYVSILTTHGQIGYKLYDPNIYGDVMVKNAGERLESIKAAHKSSHGASSVRMEDYLEVIAELVDLKGYATTLDSDDIRHTMMMGTSGTKEVSSPRSAY